MPLTDKEITDAVLGKGAASKPAAGSGEGAIGLLGGAARSVGAGVLNLANSATLGYLPEIVGTVGSEGKVRAALAESQQTNPIASTVGGIGGMFTGPAGAIARGASAGARAVTGTQALTRATLESHFAARAAAHIAANATGAGGAITAQRLLESRQDDPTISARLNEALSDTRSPVTLGLAALGGAATARFTFGADPVLRQTIQKYERITGNKVTPDVLTDSVELQKLFDTMARTPGLERAVATARKSIVDGMRTTIREVGRQQGASGTRKDVAPKAAEAVARLAGRERADGLVARARKAPEAAAMRAERGNVLSRAQQGALASGIQSVTSTRASTERIGEFGGVLDDFQALLARGKPIRLDELEGLRQSIGDMAFARASLPPRGLKEAKEMYALLGVAIDHAGPRFSQALKAGERLHRMEDALGGLQKFQEVDDALASRFFADKGVMRRIGALEEFSSPQDVSALKGWYFHRLMESIVDSDGLISEAKLRKLVASDKGMFNRQVLDRVLPGARSELEDFARLSTRMRKGVMAREGSQTGSRLIRQGLVTGAPAAVAGAVTWLLSNPYSALQTIIGVGGLQQATTMALRSLASGGAVAQGLNRLSTEGPRGLSRLPAALQSESAAPVTEPAESILGAFTR